MHTKIIAAAVLLMSAQAFAEDWTGPYAGVLAGTTGGGYSDEFYNFTLPYSGLSAGAFAGYRFETGNLITGIEVAGMISSMERTEDILFTNTVMGMGAMATARAVIAYDTGTALPYFGLGATVGEQRFISGAVGFGRDAEWHLGAHLAVGVDLPIKGDTFLRAEVNYTRFRDATYDLGRGTFTAWPTPQIGGLVGVGLKF